MPQIHMQLPNFKLISTGRYKHEATGLLFTLIEGKSFNMGINETEELLLRDRPIDLETEFVDEFLSEHMRTARPIIEINLRPFLMSDFPLDVEFVTNNWGFNDLQLSDRGAAYIPDSDSVIPLLDKLGLRLPSEAEWEFCHRKFTPTFKISYEDLLKMEPEDGICGFGSYAELCADAWHPSLSELPRNGIPRSGNGRRTVRGGAANLFPWQGCGEWLNLMPFCRYSETQAELLSVRPAVTIENLA